jgi:hypothetical protein
MKGKEKSGHVLEATSQRGEKMRTSARGEVRSRDFAVRTQKMEGSMWSTEIEPTLTNLVKSYLYGTFSKILVSHFNDLVGYK